MAEALDGSFGNPSSLHQAGQQARRLVERARAQVAALVGAETDEIIFTSGGTEADNLAVLGAMAAAPPGRRRLVTTTIEHHAVLEPCEYLRARGTEVTAVGVDGEGRLDLDALAAAIGPETALVSVMLANNDTGAVEPVAEVARIARAARGARAHRRRCRRGQAAHRRQCASASLCSRCRRTSCTAPRARARSMSGAALPCARCCTAAGRSARCDRARRTCRPSSASARRASWRALGWGAMPRAWRSCAIVSRPPSWRPCPAAASTARVALVLGCPTPPTSPFPASTRRRSRSISTSSAWPPRAAPRAARATRRRRMSFWPWDSPCERGALGGALLVRPRDHGGGD